MIENACDLVQFELRWNFSLLQKCLDMLWIFLLSYINIFKMYKDFLDAYK